MLDGKSEIVVQILQRVDITKCEIYVILSFLTITLDWKPYLPERVDFFEAAKEHVKRKRGEDMTERYLGGLE